MYQLFGVWDTVLRELGDRHGGAGSAARPWLSNNEGGTDYTHTHCLTLSGEEHDVGTHMVRELIIIMMLVDRGETV